MPDNKESKYRRQKLPGEIDEATIISGGISTLPSVVNRPGRQKISEDRVELSTFNQLDIMDIYRLLHSTSAESFSSSHGTFTKIDHILGYTSFQLKCS